MSDVRLFSSDLDGTLVGNPESPARFRDAWQSIPTTRRPYLCYNTGRLVQDTLALVDAVDLPRPDYILGGVGTQLWCSAHGHAVPGFTERFDEGWDLPLVERIVAEFPGTQRQPAAFLHPYKSSWFLEGATPEVVATLEAQLGEAGLAVAVVYSGRRFLDVLPRQASKGRALIWLAQHLEIPLNAIIVAGDSGNDSAMFGVPGVRGILVENAEADLLQASVGLNVYAARGAIADGVVNGLEHFGLLTTPGASP